MAEARHGVAAVVDVVTGLVVDYEVLSMYCHSCSCKKAQLGADSPAFTAWYAEHQNDCSINYHGSSNAMEVEAAKRWVTSSRYHDKLRLINGEDPYERPKKDWNFDPNSLPAIAYPDIVNYCVYSQSAYTLNDLKGYKSLEAYNQFICGWVSDVCAREVSGHVVVTARVSVTLNRLATTRVQPPSGLWPVALVLLSTNLHRLIESSAC